MSAFLNGFNAANDRYNRESAARLFGWMWPDSRVSRACAANLASSIRTAHKTAEGSWEVTMFTDHLRLNVGQVEALSLRAAISRFLFRAPMGRVNSRRFKITMTNRPAYRAVPVPSGFCDVPANELPSLPSAVRIAHDAFIEAAASFKRVSPFRRSHSPAVLEHLEEILGEPLPRPNYLSQDVELLLDEIISSPIRERARYRVTVNAYERDRIARRRCIEAHGTDCVICGFSFGATYGAVADGFIHVHHLRALSEIGHEYEIDPVADLRPVCPNCHAVLHRPDPAFSVEQVKAFLRQPTRRVSSNGGRESGRTARRR